MLSVSVRGAEEEKKEKRRRRGRRRRRRRRRREEKKKVKSTFLPYRGRWGCGLRPPGGEEGLLNAKNADENNLVCCENDLVD